MEILITPYMDTLLPREVARVFLMHHARLEGNVGKAGYRTRSLLRGLHVEKVPVKSNFDDWIEECEKQIPDFSGEVAVMAQAMKADGCDPGTMWKWETSTAQEMPVYLL